MTDKERECVLVSDEMVLKSKFLYNRERDYIDGFEDFGTLGTTQHHADHTLVFMLCGISVKWNSLWDISVKHPILKSLVYTCLHKHHSIGFLPVALICDQGATN